jgi:hypothetical protein
MEQYKELSIKTFLLLVFKVTLKLVQVLTT